MRSSGQQPGGLQATAQSKAVASLLHKEMARIQSGLCLYHFNYGDKAHSCTPLCNWDGLVNAISPGQLVQAFPRGHRRCRFYFSTLFNQPPLWSSVGWRSWSVYPVLGGEAVLVILQWEGIQLAFSTGCCAVARYRGGIFEQLRTAGRWCR